MYLCTYVLTCVEKKNRKFLLFHFIRKLIFISYDIMVTINYGKSDCKCMSFLLLVFEEKEEE